MDIKDKKGKRVGRIKKAILTEKALILTISGNEECIERLRRIRDTQLVI